MALSPTDPDRCQLITVGECGGAAFDPLTGDLYVGTATGLLRYRVRLAFWPADKRTQLPVVPRTAIVVSPLHARGAQ